MSTTQQSMTDQIKAILERTDATNEQKSELISYVLNGMVVPEQLICTPDGYYYKFPNTGDVERVIIDQNLIFRIEQETVSFAIYRYYINNSHVNKILESIGKILNNTAYEKCHPAISTDPNMIVVSNNKKHQYYTAKYVNNTLVRHGPYFDRFNYVIFDNGKVKSHTPITDEIALAYQNLWLSVKDPGIMIHFISTIVFNPSFRESLDVKHIRRIGMISTYAYSIEYGLGGAKIAVIDPDPAKSTITPKVPSKDKLFRKWDKQILRAYKHDHVEIQTTQQDILKEYCTKHGYTLNVLDGKSTILF